MLRISAEMSIVASVSSMKSSISESYSDSESIRSRFVFEFLESGFRRNSGEGDRESGDRDLLEEDGFGRESERLRLSESGLRLDNGPLLLFPLDL
jgi:hypothetical protein